MQRIQDSLENLLPYDGELTYYPEFLGELDSKELYDNLNKDILWEHDEFQMYGKRIITRRKVAWYGNRPYEYSYSGMRRKAHPWTKALNEIKKLIEFESGDSYNTCLLNLYPEGRDGMGWHSDDEKELKPLATIASLSLGSARKFSFRHRVSKETISLELANGSLLLMKGSVQKNWLHQLPKTKKNIAPRINLTFRTILESPEHI